MCFGANRPAPFLSVAAGIIRYMNEDVRDLGQQLIAAAWEAAHVMDPETQVEKLDELVGWVEQTQAQLAGLRMRLMSEARLAGADAVIDRVRVSSRTTTQRAAADIRLAGDLSEDYGLIMDALCEGSISGAQAEAMVIGLKKLPARLTRAELEQCQTMLVSEADVLGPHELRVLATRMMELIDPETAEEAEAARLAREERRARAGRSLRIKPDFHGSMRIIGQLPLADGALLQAQLDALLPAASSYASEDQVPSMDARRADALVALAQIAAHTGELPAHGLDRPNVHIALDFEALRDGIGAAGLLHSDDDGGLTAGEARRLACDANLIPVVLGGPSQPLDVGRTHRLVPKALRTALMHRDQGCAFPHCTTPVAACEAHHIRPWWAGGETSLGNAVLLCPRHHRLVEPDPQQSAASQWEARIDAATGLPMFIPPRYIDPARRPRQHRRHRLAILKLAPDTEPGTVSDTTGPPPGQKPMSDATSEKIEVSTPSHRRIARLKLPPPPDPRDDPWHPDYQPPHQRNRSPVLSG